MPRPMPRNNTPISLAKLPGRHGLHIADLFSGPQDAVDGRVDVIGGGRVSRRNSQVAAEHSVSRVPESYTQRPTIVRVRTASGRNSPAVGKGVSNSNLQIVKTRMTGQAAGSDGVMYNVRSVLIIMCPNHA